MVVSYNQSGYIGTSMSVRQKEQYDAGEMPISKWTKADILSLVRRYYPAQVYNTVSKWRQDDLRSVFLYQSSWHHSGSYAKRVDFYSFDEDVSPERISDANRCVCACAREKKPTEPITDHWQVQDWIQWVGTRNHPKPIRRRSVINWKQKGYKTGMVKVYPEPWRIECEKQFKSFSDIREIPKPRVNSKVWKELY